MSNNTFVRIAIIQQGMASSVAVFTDDVTTEEITEFMRSQYGYEERMNDRLTISDAYPYDKETVKRVINDSPDFNLS